MGGHGFRNGKHGGKSKGRGYGTEFRRSDGKGRGGLLLAAALATLGSKNASDDKDPDRRGVENDNWGAGEYGSQGRPFGRSANARPEPRSKRPKLRLGAALVALVLWSLFAWVGYGLVDSILAWASSNVGALVETGKDAAAATGIGKEVVGAVDSVQTTGFLAGLANLVGVVLRPLIVVAWALGAALILAMPWLVSLLRRRF
ncbi:hypothetical protein ACFFTN_05455 [Aminobacter aganoensis]|uniref:Uncharacterized protein n=1 Tax=Aminobacter aganoensis TaxID=83264 RepID=A0A7X0F584_9HYPH|nr:hypothetical protein [Aminobacter aganoensis]MBB6353215.1 hypothetical protein [Aminobacter aganoensis]